MPNNYIFVTFLEDFHNYSHSGIKFLASDFYNRNLIMRAVLDNRQKTASIVAAFICDLDDSIPYDIEFMRALPFLMDKQPDNIKINEYFE